METHAKTLVNQDNLKNFDILIKDESFIKIIFKTQQIDLEELDKMLWLSLIHISEPTRPY